MSNPIRFVDAFSVRRAIGIAYDGAVISSIEDLNQRLAKLGLKRSRHWLAEQTGYKENSIRQYLSPNSKGTPKFMKEASKAIEQEEARQKLGKPEAPPWNLIFLTHEQFVRADRASRIVKAESLEDFCRHAILSQADEILAQKTNSSYPLARELPGFGSHADAACSPSSYPLARELPAKVAERGSGRRP